MSDNIPFEIQQEIIKRVVPVRSLLRFRSVSKRWKSLIDSSDFIAHHHHLVNHPENLLVRYVVDFKYEYLSIADDDDNFPQQKFSPVITPIVKKVKYATIFDSSDGLVCLYGRVDCVVDGKNLVTLWNPSIGKSVSIELPHGSRAFGFGVCPKTLDPKILKITRSYKINLPVELFTLSSGAFRTILTDIPRALNHFAYNPDQKVIDGVIYWETYNGEQNAIVSFDLTTEEFGEVELPDVLADGNLKISKIKGSLAVLDFVENEDVCHVWTLMKNGLAKLFTVRNDTDRLYPYNIIGFRRNGEVIRKQTRGSDGSLVTLEAYEPSTKHRTDLGTHVASRFAEFPYLLLTSYSESLLLVNRSGSIFQG